MKYEILEKTILPYKFITIRPTEPLVGKDIPIICIEEKLCYDKFLIEMDSTFCKEI